MYNANDNDSNRDNNDDNDNDNDNDNNNDNANDNYSRYHILEKKYNAWQTWYNQQRIIHQQVTKE